MKKTTKTELQSQIVTDNVLNFLSYMPNPDNIAGGTFDSYETYRKMRTDPRIQSLLNTVIKPGVLNFPLHIEQGESDTKVYEFVKSLKLFRNMNKKLKRILSGLDYGFSVSELTWKINGAEYIPDNFITRKPERFSFDYDWNLYLNNTGRKLLNQDYKWLIYRHDPDDENPYGTSVLRSVYWAWCFKEAGYDFWLQATEKFSVKSLLALFECDGDDETIRTRANEIAQMLMGVTSGSTAGVGNVREIKDIGMTGDLSHFKDLVEACDTQICYGLTGQAIATSTTDGGSLALGKVQSDLIYNDCKNIALELQGVIQKIIDWTVELNFGADTITPQFVFDVDRRASFDEVMKAIDHKVPVSKSSLYSYYGVPEPKDEKDSFVMPEQSAVMLSDSFSKNDVKKNFQFS